MKRKCVQVEKELPPTPRTLLARLAPYQRATRVWFGKQYRAAKFRIEMTAASVANAWAHATLWLPLAFAFRRNIPLTQAASFMQEAVEAAGLEPAEYGFHYNQAVKLLCPLFACDPCSRVPRRVIGVSGYSPRGDNLIAPYPGQSLHYVSVKPRDLRKAIKTYVAALRAFNGTR